MDSILQTTLAAVIQQLADFFGMTTDVIMQNAPMWLAKYGWFTMMQNLPMIIFLWAVVFGCLFALVCWAGYEWDWKKGTIILLCVLSFLLSAALIFGAWFGQCAIAPELYGLNALLQLIK